MPTAIATMTSTTPVEARVVATQSAIPPVAHDVRELHHDPEADDGPDGYRPSFDVARGVLSEAGPEAHTTTLTPQGGVVIHMRARKAAWALPYERH